MQLSAEIFDQIVNTLQNSESTDDEKRRKPRIGLRAARVTIMPMDDDGKPESPLSVHVRDISSGGICVSDHEAMRRGKRFVVRLPRNGAEAVLLVCTVRHCLMISDDLFSIGAEFEQECTQVKPAPGTTGKSEAA